MKTKPQTKKEKYGYCYVGGQIDKDLRGKFKAACNAHAITPAMLVQRAVKLYIEDVTFRLLIHGCTMNGH